MTQSITLACDFSEPTIQLRDKNHTCKTKKHSRERAIESGWSDRREVNRGEEICLSPLNPPQTQFSAYTITYWALVMYLILVGCFPFILHLILPGLSCLRREPWGVWILSHLSKAPHGWKVPEAWGFEAGLCGCRACLPSISSLPSSNVQLCSKLPATLTSPALEEGLLASCPLTVKNHRVRSPQEISTCRAPLAERPHIQLRGAAGWASAATSSIHQLGSLWDKMPGVCTAGGPGERPGCSWNELTPSGSRSPSREMEGGKETGSGWSACSQEAAGLRERHCSLETKDLVFLSVCSQDFLHHTHLACWKMGFLGHKHNKSKFPRKRTGICMLGTLSR